MEFQPSEYHAKNHEVLGVQAAADSVPQVDVQIAQILGVQAASDSAPQAGVKITVNVNDDICARKAGTKASDYTTVTNVALREEDMELTEVARGLHSCKTLLSKGIPTEEVSAEFPSFQGLEGAVTMGGVDVKHDIKLSFAERREYTMQMSAYDRLPDPTTLKCQAKGVPSSSDKIGILTGMELKDVLLSLHTQEAWRTSAKEDDTSHDSCAVGLDIDATVYDNKQTMMLSSTSLVLADARPIEAAGCMENLNNRVSLHSQEAVIATAKVEGIADAADGKECNLMNPYLTRSSSQDKPRRPSMMNVCDCVEASREETEDMSPTKRLLIPMSNSSGLVSAQVPLSKPAVKEKAQSIMSKYYVSELQGLLQLDGPREVELVDDCNGQGCSKASDWQDPGPFIPNATSPVSGTDSISNMTTERKHHIPFQKNQPAEIAHSKEDITEAPFESFLGQMMKAMAEKFKKSLGTERRRALHEAAMIEFRGHGPDPSQDWIPGKVLQMLRDLQVCKESSFNPLFDHLWLPWAQEVEYYHHSDTAMVCSLQTSDKGLQLKALANAIFSWAIPTRPVLEYMVAMSNGKIAEIGSGRGYWAGLLKKLGANVVAVDNFSEKHSFSLCFPDTIHMDAEEFVKQGGAQGRALFFCWPRKDYPLRQLSSANACRSSCLAEACLNAFHGDTIFFVGERHDGITFDMEAWMQETPRRRRMWRLEKEMNIPCWPGVRDVFMCFVRQNEASGNKKRKKNKKKLLRQKVSSFENVDVNLKAATAAYPESSLCTQQ